MSVIHRLDWDSTFFNLNIAKMEVLDGLDFQQFKNEAKNYDLIYLFSSQQIIELQSCLYDKKVRYTINKKDISPLSFGGGAENRVLEYAVGDNYKELLDLAFVSGHRSRFFLDERMGVDRFQKLYTKWVDNSINDKHNTQIFVIEDFGKLEAFVVQKKDELEMSISLIATKESSRGKGYGKMLVQKVFSNFLKSDADVLSVYTQLDNTGACAFYEKMGFRLENVKYIYHYWS